MDFPVTVHMDCGCDVEVSKDQILAEDLKEYLGGKITRFCEKHKLPFKQEAMLKEAIRRCKEIEQQESFVSTHCTFPKCRNREICEGNRYVCPAMVTVNGREI